MLRESSWSNGVIREAVSLTLNHALNSLRGAILLLQQHQRNRKGTGGTIRVGMRGGICTHVGVACEQRKRIGRLGWTSSAMENRADYS